MVIWAPKSILDLREAWDFIAADSETAADRIISTLQRAGESLDQFPKLGRAGRVSHTRELVVAGTAPTNLMMVLNLANITQTTLETPCPII